jgi:hypothetical protein
MESREAVLNHPKFQEIFGEYADALGIKSAPEPKEWASLKLKKEEIDKRVAEEAEKKRIAELEKQEQERRRIEREEARRKAGLMKEYFKLIAQKDLTKYVGTPKKIQMAKVAA